MHVCLAESRRECQSSWSCSYRQLGASWHGCWVVKLGSSGRAAHTFPIELSIQPAPGLGYVYLHCKTLSDGIMKWPHISPSTPLYPHFPSPSCLLKACCVKIIKLDCRKKLMKIRSCCSEIVAGKHTNYCIGETLCSSIIIKIICEYCVMNCT